jgi:DNA-binding NtrC family response regulator
MLWEKLMNILIVDDDRDSCEYLAKITANLKVPELVIQKAYSGNEAYKAMDRQNFEIVLSDVGLPDISGLEIAEKFIHSSPRTKIILISGNEEIIQSINSIDSGIYDFLTKPVDVKKLVEIIRNALKDIKRSASGSGMKLDDILNGHGGLIRMDQIENWVEHSVPLSKNRDFAIFSDKMDSVYKKINKLKDYPQIPILIRGETGTGKEVLARHMHYDNPDIEGAFVALNCSNLGRDLFESELFGYEKGAFTGADKAGKEGKIKAAENGTLFMDEIGEIPLGMQAKLLRIIEEKEYFMVGGSSIQPVRARLVFATNRDLREMTGAGQFREDLYFRLNLCEIWIPPLRERKEEIIPLSLYLFYKIGKELGKQPEEIESAAFRLLEGHNFPGNIRELKNIITKAVLFCDNIILEKNIHELIAMPEKKSPPAAAIDLKTLELPDQPFDLEELNMAIIKKALKKFNGNKSKTAEYLGLNRIQLYGRYKEAINKI